MLNIAVNICDDRACKIQAHLHKLHKFRKWCFLGQCLHCVNFICFLNDLSMQHEIKISCSVTYFESYSELKFKIYAKFCVQICPVFTGPVKVSFTMPIMYAGIMLNAFNDTLCSNLWWHNRQVSIVVYESCNTMGTMGIIKYFMQYESLSHATFSFTALTRITIVY